MIASTAPLSDAFAPSPRLARLRHELATLIDCRDRADDALAAEAEAVYFAEPGAELRADCWASRSVALDRQIAAVRRAIIAEANARAVAR